MKIIECCETMKMLISANSVFIDEETERISMCVCDIEPAVDINFCPVCSKVIQTEKETIKKTMYQVVSNEINQYGQIVSTFWYDTPEAATFNYTIKGNINVISHEFTLEV